MYLEGNRRWVPLLGATYAFRVTYEREGLVDKEETPALYDHLWTEHKFNYFLCEYLKFVILKVPNLYEMRLDDGSSLFARPCGLKHWFAAFFYFWIPNNTLCLPLSPLPPKWEDCIFHFLRACENNNLGQIWGTNRVYYGLFENSQWFLC